MRSGLDHVILVKLATAAVSATLLGLTRDAIINTCRNASWTARRSARIATRPIPDHARVGPQAMRQVAGVRLALISATGEMGYPSALTAPVWGFYDASFRGKEFRLGRPYGHYVMENVLFKVSYPAEFHAQTAVEAALQLHERIKELGRDPQKSRAVTIRTHRAAMRIIDKSGPLANPADRDHCIQYMVAVPLLYGRLTAQDYEDNIAADPRIDELRSKMTCVEDETFTARLLRSGKTCNHECTPDRYCSGWYIAARADCRISDGAQKTSRRSDSPDCCRNFGPISRGAS